jgi:hypothetical protein
LLHRVSDMHSHHPSRRLLLAVLEDAVITFEKCATARDHRGRRIFLETEAWFRSDDTAAPFSFIAVCDALGLDPDYVRSGVWRRFARRPFAVPKAEARDAYLPGTPHREPAPPRGAAG